MKRVLLVEDEALVALLACDVLEEGGYEIVGPADRLAGALALAGNEALDAALLDINLAGEAVWPVAELLGRRRIPFVLVSGYGDSLPMPAGCAPAQRLSKPYDGQSLLRALALAMDNTIAVI